jgi:F-type H+-transporting ATPase subunit alpha
VAGRLRLDLSQYRELEAFAQFGSELDLDTQRTLARGERLVATLNQRERSPMSVEDQVVQVYAATTGYLDRITVDRVPEFLDQVTKRVRSEHAELLEKIGGGDWSDETVEALDKAIAEFADDFGYDLDDEGQPMEEGESDRVAKRDDEKSGDSDGDDEADDDTEEQSEEDREEEPAPAA